MMRKDKPTKGIVVHKAIRDKEGNVVRIVKDKVIKPKTFNT